MTCPVKRDRWQMASRALALRSAIGSGPQVPDRNDVQTVDRHDLTITVHHRKGARSDQNHLRMPDGVFATVRGAQRKGMETTARDALADSFQIHSRTVSLPPWAVKRDDLCLLINDHSFTDPSPQAGLAEGRHD